MNEKEYIQYRGFRNIFDDTGEAVGFEFRHRLAYYRGVWLSQLRVGRVIVDGEESAVSPGSVITLRAGQKHTLMADTDMNVIEVQMGQDITREDKIHHEEELLR